MTRCLPFALLALLVFSLPPAAARAVRQGLRLPVPVYRTVAVAAGGRIYVLGGHDSAGGTISGVYAFNPATGVSRRAGSLALPTHGAAAANLGGRILIFGGASTSVHDSSSSSCRAAATRSWSGTCRPCAPT